MNYLSTNLNNYAIEKKKRISSRVLSLPSLKKKKKRKYLIKTGNRTERKDTKGKE